MSRDIRSIKSVNVHASGIHGLWNGGRRYPFLPRTVSRCVAILATIVLGTYLFSATAFPQSYTWKNVDTSGGGGFIPGMIFNPSQQNLIYVRTDIGGAYRWDPTNNHWIPLMDWVGFDDWNTLGVESIATDPVDPMRFYVAAGTYTNSFTSANGAILRSTDQGNTFARTNLPFKLGGNMPGRSMGERLVIDPNLNSTLFFGARSGNGLWKSIDFGATWNKVTSFTAVATYVQTPGDIYLGDTDGIVWELFDPRTGTPGHATQTIYVGIADKANSIFRSTDGGATWAAVPGQPTGFLPHHGVLSSDGTLYITYSNNAGPFDGTSGDVWKYNTATAVWTKISPVPSTDTANDFFGYGGLSVDTLHPQTIMVSALNSWWPDTIFFRSIDGGTTWTRIWDWAGFPNRTLRYTQDITLAPWLNFGVTNPVAPVPAPKLGWMVGTLAIDPFNSDHMIYGTGATLYGTNNLTAWDAGKTINITVAAQGIEEAAVLDLVSPPSGAHLYSALGDIGGFRHDDLTKSPAAMYSIPFAGSYTSIDFAEVNPNFLARVGNGNPNASPAIRSSAFTFDGGNNWFQGNNDPAGLAANSGGTIAAAADASRVVWNPSGLGAFVSTDNGNTWIASTGFPSGGRVASDRVNPKKFYGFSNGKFYVSTDGGATFTASAATGLPAVGDSFRFKAVPGHEGDVWLAGGSNGSGVYGLWHSTDSGATFTKLANVDKADTIGFGMAATGKTYVALFTSAQIGGVRGIFRSDDAGASWVRINDDQHQYASTNAAITGDPRIFGRVYFSTNGRGIIYGDIGTGVAIPDFSLSDNPASLTINTGTRGTSTITVTPLNGFTSNVALSASGLPSGVTSSFSALSSTGTSTLTLTAATTATTGATTVTVTGTGGGTTHTTSLSLMVKTPPAPDFSLSASSSSLTINTGGSGTETITVTPAGGFVASVALSASGLPTGVTAAFNPASTTGTSTLTLTASSTATTGPATVTVTGTGGGLTHTVTISLTVVAPPPPSFSLTASPSSVSINQGATATSVITVTSSGGFAGSVTLSASGLPSGVTASFSPASTTGASTVTFTASATATVGAATAVTITGTSGALARSATVSLTVSAGTGNTGGVTVATVINSNGAFFNDQGVKLSNTAALTALSITITMQATTGVTFSGQYNTVGGSIVQSHSSTASAITYQFTLSSGQTLATGTNWLFDAQAGGTGTVHPSAGDTFTVTYTTGGSTFTQSGHF
ncbi:MAG TPA: xyloglucanase [Candidatus Angelobacter sp.]|nr:xyloglucanase [Candidatus Angelobacter sp.]